MKEIRTLLMRGGTTQGLMFHREDLPEDRGLWNNMFLSLTGSYDAKKVDGVDVAKILVLWKSDRADTDVEYLVGHVLPERGTVDYGSNCGNMTVAVGPYAVLEGMVEVREPVTRVRLLNVNTDKRIDSYVPIDPKTHTFAMSGDCKMAGIRFDGAEVKVDFVDPAASSSDSLLPTGNPIDRYEIPGLGTIEGTVVDASSATVLFRAEDFGMTGAETPAEIEANHDRKEKLELARCMCSVKMRVAKDLEDAHKNYPAVPRIGVFSAPKNFDSTDHIPVRAEDMDINIRLLSMERCHRALALSSANAIAVSCCLKGGIIEKTLGLFDGAKGVRLGNPTGVIELYPDVSFEDGKMTVKGVACKRTARLIMRGDLYIPE